jgi:hypothetical protein
MADIGFPVSGSLVEIIYEGTPIAYGQGLKLDMKVDYKPVRQLGRIYPVTFVINFVTVSGGFSIADTAAANWLQVITDQIDSSSTSSDPSQWGSFCLRAIAGNNDAPTYTVTNVRFVDLSPTVDISGNLLETTITFVGLRLKSE